jgi:hypothetical protein
VRVISGRVGWRWLVVTASVVVLCSLPVLASALPVSVPALTAAQLKDKILASQSMSFDGYAESDATFGLPPLGAFSSVADLLDGVTKVEVWQASPTHWRVDALQDASERDEYQDGPATEFTWDSQQELLTEITGQPSIRLPVAADLVPSSLGVRLIKEAGSRATLSLLPPRRVAGQSAAGLRITPTDPSSTIGHVDIWANPHTGLPLLVDITARGASHAALETQFFQVTPWHPVSSILTPDLTSQSSFTTTSANGLAGELNNLFFQALPSLLDGRQLTTVPVPGAGVYGNGLAAFAVLAIRGGGGLVADAISAGATPFTTGDVQGAYASAPLINLVVVNEPGRPAAFLLAGLVNRTVLMKAASQLVDNSWRHRNWRIAHDRS